jgi:hypothetical protein
MDFLRRDKMTGNDTAKEFGRRAILGARLHDARNK